MSDHSTGSTEASLIGSGFGAFIGGGVFSMAADLLELPTPTLLAFAIGGVLGAIAGLIFGRIAFAFLGRL